MRQPKFCWMILALENFHSHINLPLVFMSSRASLKKHNPTARDDITPRYLGLFEWASREWPRGKPSPMLQDWFLLASTTFFSWHDQWTLTAPSRCSYCVHQPLEAATPGRNSFSGHQNPDVEYRKPVKLQISRCLRGLAMLCKSRANFLLSYKQNILVHKQWVLTEVRFVDFV